MPIYVYACSACGYSFDSLCSIAKGAAKVKEPCPECGGPVTRPFTANKSAVHLRYSPMHPRHMRGMRK